MGALVTSAKSSPRSTVLKLLLVAAMGICVVAMLAGAGIPVSRRMCNLSYAVLILSINALVLGLLALVDLCWPWHRPPIALAYGGGQDSMLVSFLVANLLTGAVNILLQPLMISYRVSL